MFDSLRDRLDKIFTGLTGRGALSEGDVDLAMRDIRRALLEADVALDVVRDFIEKVRAEAIGADVVRSISPGQMVVKIVHDVLVETLGKDNVPLNVIGRPPVVMMLVGLQGSGKTTTTAKIANRLSQKDKKKVLMASLDVYRPAAQEQLSVLGGEIRVDVLPIVSGQDPLAITDRAVQAASLGGYDILLLDTAGRTHIDEGMMQEAEAVKKRANPLEVLLVVDALTGQDAVNVARTFNERVEVTGIAMTRVDGDSRGGAALSMRAVTGKPIKLMGVGEKWDALEDFHPGRLADRILGMGDIVSLVEKASEQFDADRAQKMARRMQKGIFDLNDLVMQLKQMEKMGGMSGMLSMLPGMNKMKGLAGRSEFEDKAVKRQIALVYSMTKKERRAPQILNFSRKQRVVRGAGASLQDLNKLLKLHQQLAKMMKKVAGNPELAASLMGGMGGDPSQLAGQGGGAPGAMPDLASLGGMSGLGDLSGLTKSSQLSSLMGKKPKRR